MLTTAHLFHHAVARFTDTALDDVEHKIRERYSRWNLHECRLAQEPAAHISCTIHTGSVTAPLC